MDPIEERDVERLVAMLGDSRVQEKITLMIDKYFEKEIIRLEAEQMKRDFIESKEEDEHVEGA